MYRHGYRPLFLIIPYMVLVLLFGVSVPQVGALRLFGPSPFAAPGAASCTGGGSLTRNVWTHVACTFEASVGLRPGIGGIVGP